MNNLNILRSRNIFLVVLGILIFNIIFLIKYPIYTDEINWLLTISRNIFDNGIYYHYLKPCIENSLEIVPLFKIQMLVLALYGYISSIYALRFIPLLCILYFIYQFYRNIDQNEVNKYTFTGLLIVIIFCSAGSIWAIILRPEHLIILYVALFYQFIKYSTDKSEIHLKYYLILVSVWSIVTIAHPKAIYFLPLNILIIKYVRTSIFRKSLLFLFSIYYAVAVSQFDTKILLNCYNYPSLEKFINSMNLNPLLLLSDPILFYHDFTSTIRLHLSNLIDRAADHLTYLKMPTTPLLPTISLSPIISLVNYLIKSLWIFNLIFGLYYFINLIRNNIFEDKRATFLFGMYFFLVINILLNRTTNHYDIFLWLILLSFLNINSYVKLNKSCKILPKYLLFITVFFIITTIIQYHYYYKVYIHSWYINNPPVNTSIKYIEPKNRSIILNDFINHCDPENKSDLIIIDDNTYISLRKISAKLAPVSYVAGTIFYNQSIAEREHKYQQFFNNYKFPVFYGSCNVSTEIPKNSKLIFRNESLNLCCRSLK